MAFEFSKGSDGDGPSSFSLYVPVSFSDGYHIKPDTLPDELDISSVRLHVEIFSYGYTMTVRGFNSKKEAQAFFPKLRSALLWLSIRKKVGVSCPAELSSPFLKERIIEHTDTDTIAEAARHFGWRNVDGIYDGRQAVVYPEHKKIVKTILPNADMYISSPCALVCRELAASISLGHNEHVLADRKLVLAAQLYSAFHFEKTKTVRLVQLITVIEALLPKMRICNCSQEALEVAAKTVKDLPVDDYSGHQLKERNRLINRIQGLTNESIGKRRKRLVQMEVARFPKLGEAQVLTDKLEHAYGVRSELVHDGKSPPEDIDKAVAFLMEFVPSLLEQRYVECAVQIDVQKRG